MPRRALILCLLIVLVLLISMKSPSNVVDIMRNWLHDAVPLVALALAAGIIISCGQIDIASGAIFSLSGMLIVDWTHRFATGGMSLIYACFAAWGLTIAFYLAMYVLVIVRRIPALLCTLGLAFCAQSAALWLQSSLNGQSLTVPIEGPIKLFSWSIPWMLLVLGVLVIWRYVSDFGLLHIAVGLDPKAAQIAAVKTKAVYLSAFLIAGALVGLSSILFLADFQRGGWSANTGWGKELFAIAAAVFGGCRITGGRFDPICISLATLLVVAVRDASSVLSRSVELENLFLGAGVIVVALLDFSEHSRQRSSVPGPERGRRSVPAAGAAA